MNRSASGPIRTFAALRIETSCPTYCSSSQPLFVQSVGATKLQVLSFSEMVPYRSQLGATGTGLTALPDRMDDAFCL